MAVSVLATKVILSLQPMGRTKHFPIEADCQASGGSGFSLELRKLVFDTVYAASCIVPGTIHVTRYWSCGLGLTVLSVVARGTTNWLFNCHNIGEWNYVRCPIGEHRIASLRQESIIWSRSAEDLSPGLCRTSQ